MKKIEDKVLERLRRLADEGSLKSQCMGKAKKGRLLEMFA